MTLRERFLDLGREQIGKPSLWGAKTGDAFDCSGLVAWLLRELGGPDLRATHNTDRMWLEFDPVVGEPAPGDLGFYRPKKPLDDNDMEHVVILLDGGLILTADGATSKIHTVEDAKAAHAMVRIRGGYDYRERFAGWRRFPLVEDAVGRPVLACQAPIV